MTLARHAHCPRARLPVVQLIHPETHLMTRTKTQALREGTETLCPGRFLPLWALLTLRRPGLSFGKFLKNAYQYADLHGLRAGQSDEPCLWRQV